MSGAAVVIAHHFAKGDSSQKDAIHRMSGAGAWARNPDSILVLTPHEEENCFTVSTILRNHPIQPDFVVEWQYPCMRVVEDLDPASLRRQGKQKAMTDRKFLELFLTREAQAFGKIVQAVKDHGLSSGTVKRYLARLTKAEVVMSSGGLYWLPEPSLSQGEPTNTN